MDQLTVLVATAVSQLGRQIRVAVLVVAVVVPVLMVVGERLVACPWGDGPN